MTWWLDCRLRLLASVEGLLVLLNAADEILQLVLTGLPIEDLLLILVHQFSPCLVDASLSGNQSLILFLRFINARLPSHGLGVSVSHLPLGLSESTLLGLKICLGCIQFFLGARGGVDSIVALLLDAFVLSHSLSELALESRLVE